MERELKQAIGDANANAGIGAIVVTGAGRARFCAGADIGDTFAERDGGSGVGNGGHRSTRRTSRSTGWSCVSGRSRSSRP